MAKSLLEWETLDTEQIHDIMEGRAPRPPKSTGSVPPTGGTVRQRRHLSRRATRVASEPY